MAAELEGSTPAAPVEWVVAENPGPMTLDGTRSYLVGRERLVIIDPGPLSRKHLEGLRDRAGGRPVEAVCLTHSHADHAGAAAETAQAFRAPVAGSSETLGRCGLEGRVLHEGDVLEVDGSNALCVLETPGHSSDHLCFLLTPERSLFTGDLVLGSGTSAILHPDGDMAAYMASLARLLALRPSRIYPGHGSPVENAAGLLAHYRSHRRSREEQIVRALEAGHRSLADIREAVYGPLPEDLRGAAEASIAAHLVHLTRRGVDLPPIPGLGSSGTEDA